MPSNGRLPQVLTSRGTLVIFGFLTATWLLPEVVSTTAPGVFNIVGPPLQVLVIPAYLVNMLVYDGWLEAIIYPVSEVAPVLGPVLWDAGLVSVFYLFAVGATLVGRSLARWAGQAEPRAFSSRYLLAGVLVAFGGLLLLSGTVSAVSQPTVTMTSCSASGTASEDGTVTTVTQECTTETRPNPFPDFSLASGAIVSVLGLAIGFGDSLLARWQRRP